MIQAYHGNSFLNFENKHWEIVDIFTLFLLNPPSPFPPGNKRQFQSWLLNIISQCKYTSPIHFKYETAKLRNSIYSMHLSKQIMSHSLWYVLLQNPMNTVVYLRCESSEFYTSISKPLVLNNTPSDMSDDSPTNWIGYYNWLPFTSNSWILCKYGKI